MTYRALEQQKNHLKSVTSDRRPLPSPIVRKRSHFPHGDAKTHVSAKLSFFCAKFWLLNTQLINFNHFYNFSAFSPDTFAHCCAQYFCNLTFIPAKQIALRKVASSSFHCRQNPQKTVKTKKKHYIPLKTLLSSSISSSQL